MPSRGRCWPGSSSPAGSTPSVTPRRKPSEPSRSPCPSPTSCTCQPMTPSPSSRSTGRSRSQPGHYWPWGRFRASPPSPLWDPLCQPPWPATGGGMKTTSKAAPSSAYSSSRTWPCSAVWYWPRPGVDAAAARPRQLSRSPAEPSAGSVPGSSHQERPAERETGQRNQRQRRLRAGERQVAGRGLRNGRGQRGGLGGRGSGRDGDRCRYWDGGGRRRGWRGRAAERAREASRQVGVWRRRATEVDLVVAAVRDGGREADRRPGADAPADPQQGGCPRQVQRLGGLGGGADRERQAGQSGLAVADVLALVGEDPVDRELDRRRVLLPRQVGDRDRDLDRRRNVAEVESGRTHREPRGRRRLEQSQEAGVGPFDGARTRRGQGQDRAGEDRAHTHRGEPIPAVASHVGYIAPRHRPPLCAEVPCREQLVTGPEVQPTPFAAASPTKTAKPRQRQRQSTLAIPASRIHASWSSTEANRSSGSSVVRPMAARNSLWRDALAEATTSRLINTPPGSSNAAASAKSWRFRPS